MNHKPGGTGESAAPARIGLGTLICLAFLAGAVQYSPPFFENQGQYFAHAVTAPALQGDWFMQTADPYPLFSQVASWLLAAWHPFGVVAGAYLATFLSLLAVFLFGRATTAPDGDPRVALLATTLVAATLAQPWGYSLFNGLGNQYIVSKPAYFQPSSAGSLILLSLYLWLVRDGRARPFDPVVIGATLLVIAGCLLHPTYLVSVAVALGAWAAVQFVLDGRNRFVRYIVVGVLTLALLSWLNPDVFSIGQADAEYARALDRFAYERIAGHTLWYRWVWPNYLVPLIILGGAFAAVRWFRMDSVALWLVLCLVLSGVALLALPPLSGKLLLTMPWRISVCLVPIAGTFLACALARWLVERWRIATWHIAVIGVLIGAVGVSQTVRNWDAIARDPAVALLRAERPTGVGLIPPVLGLVRLNVPAAVYVDWKTPPYASRDLIEWWRRMDEVAALAADDRPLCEDRLAQPIDWLLVPAAGGPLSCPGQWRRAASNETWQLLVRQR
jgi:hypothetical protein